MNISSLGHANVLLTENDFTLLLDPWFGFSFHFETHHAYPPITVPDKETLAKINALHISHIHQDHCCVQSLQHFSRQIPIFISRYEDKTFLNKIVNLGFENIVEIEPGAQGLHVGPFKLFTFLSLSGAKAFDSALLVENSQKDLFFFNNDCYLYQEQLQEMKRSFSKIKGAFLGYQSINPYPICYDTTQVKNFNGPLSKPEQINRMHKRGLDNFLNICALFDIDWAVPYACGLRFFSEELFHLNETYGSKNIFLQAPSATKILTTVNYGDILNENGQTLYNAPKHDRALVSYKKSGPFPQIADDLFEPIFNIFKEKMFYYLQQVTKKWNSPMGIKYVLTGENKKAEVFFTYCNSVIESRPCEPDLIIEYRLSDIKRLVDGDFSFSQLHYMYRFKATIINMVDNQSLIHRWA